MSIEEQVLRFSDFKQFRGSSWAEFQAQVQLGRYSLGVDTTRAFQVAGSVGSKVEKIGLTFLMATPWLTALALLIAAIALGRYLLLLGIPLVLVSQFFAAGLLMRPGSGKVPVAVLSVACVLFALGGWPTLATLTGATLLQFVTRKLWYASSCHIARRYIAGVEGVFVAAFGSGITSVRDNQTGRTIWARDVA